MLVRVFVLEGVERALLVEPKAHVRALLPVLARVAAPVGTAQLAAAGAAAAAHEWPLLRRLGLTLINLLPGVFQLIGGALCEK